jgi:hypothetical protein
MRSLFKRIGTPLAMLMLAGGMEYGISFEKSSQVVSYYRELGASPEHMSRVQRALFSVLLAAGDKLQQHKRPAHASLSSVSSPASRTAAAIYPHASASA